MAGKGEANKFSPTEAFENAKSAAGTAGATVVEQTGKAADATGNLLNKAGDSLHQFKPAPKPAEGPVAKATKAAGDLFKK